MIERPVKLNRKSNTLLPLSFFLFKISGLNYLVILIFKMYESRKAQMLIYNFIYL